MTQEEYKLKIELYDRLQQNEDFKEFLNDIKFISNNILFNQSSGILTGVDNLKPYKLGYYHALERAINYPEEAIETAKKYIK